MGAHSFILILLMHKNGMSRSGELRPNMEESACLKKKNRWIRKHTHKYIMCRYITYMYIQLYTCKTPKPTKQKPVLPLPAFFLMPPSQLFSSPGGAVIVKATLENRNLWIYTVMLNRFPNALCKSTVNHQETYMLMCFFLYSHSHFRHNKLNCKSLSSQTEARDRLCEKLGLTKRPTV